MDAEHNKAVVRQYVEELNRRNEAVIDEVIAEDFAAGSLLAGAGSPEAIGREGVRAGYRRNIAAFPDYTVTIENLIAEGDRVVMHWTHRGTHRGEFLGVPGTGREIVGTAVSFYRVVGGRIAEVRALYDPAEVREQLGLVHPEAPLNDRE